MKIFKYITASALTALIALNSFADEVIDSGFTLSGGLGRIYFDDDRELENDGFWSLGLGYQFDSPWGVELNYLKGEADDDLGSNLDMDYEQLRLDGLYHFGKAEGWQPYLAFGVGNMEFDPEGGADSFEETLVNVGGGLKYFMTPALALRADVRAFNSLDEEETGLALTLAVNYLFGQPSAAPSRPAAVDGDSDRDGVKDSMDQCPDSAEGAVVDSVGCYIMEKREYGVDLQVNFATDSAVVTAGYMPKIAAVAQFMNDYPQTEVVVEGHTDSRASDSYNLELSSRRAASVAKILVEKYGIQAGRVGSRGYGESLPLADNDTAEGRAANRRVVAMISVMVESRAK